MKVISVGQLNRYVKSVLEGDPNLAAVASVNLKLKALMLLAKVQQVSAVDLIEKVGHRGVKHINFLRFILFRNYF